MKALALVLTLSWLFLTPTATADGSPTPCPTTNAALGYAGCQYSIEELHVLIEQAAVTRIRYRLDAMCVEMQEQPVCINPLRCSEPPGTYRFHIFRSEDEGATWTEIGSVCLGDRDTPSLEVLTDTRIFQEFKRLTWPEAELTIQPPDGRTLVNLRTNFFTTTTEPTTQTVTLLGQRVAIEATPVGYTWHYGDGEQDRGSEPGAPYPALEVTHVYRQAEVTVHPSVDVTYHGRYRVNGGSWQGIPDELTVAGTPSDLEVLTATPHLVE